MFNKKFIPTFNSNILEDPIRDEIFSPERLEQYAHFLASELSVTMKKERGRSLLPRIKENNSYLNASYHKLTDFVAEGIVLSPAGEWIIDNFHIIQDQVREIKEDLPEKYYLELPKINDGELSGYPRVYAMALTLVAHLDSHIDIGTVKRFVSAYQDVTPLLIGEIWAIPIALRIALLENLRRLANQSVICQEMKNKIDILADDFLMGKNPSAHELDKLTNKLSQMLGRSHACDCSAISQLSQRLHARTPEILPACECIDEYLAKKDLDIEEVVRSEHQFQAATQVSVSNAITSMRLLSNTDWQEFFESLSLVDIVLAQDPVGAYKNMLFSSRDQYRHAIERIHKKTGYGEIEIAKEAVRMAQKASHKKAKDKRKHHIGYYLIRKGVRDLEQKIHYRPNLSEKAKRMILDYPGYFYLGFLTFFTFILLAPLMFYVYWMSPHIIWPLLIAVLGIIPASDSALNILNLFVTYFVGPFILPKINLDEGIPDEAKTFAVVPTIIGSNKEIPKLLEDLEIRYLANQDKNLYFALLSDFTDADTEHLSLDDKIINDLKKGIENLNIKYNNGHKQFYLFHRKRLWNPKEKKWMGWERKRGKIHEFNCFLRGKDDTSFNIHPPNSSLFSEIKYVITLDTDTKLPRNSAKKLVGTILHPLNQPQFDQKTKMVTKGYSILQPRISITPESSEKSLFAKIYSGHTGIDPYTTAVSDAYQDLFGEGIYTGKGLYVVDTFEASLENRIPENTLLSHDLFEGVFSRTALVSDIEFLDDYPSRYESFAKRHHRWIRGDWQIIKWIFSKIPNNKEKQVSNPLSLISKWKIIDNLRRSLVAPMTLIWFVLSWSILPGHSSLWTLIILCVLALPLYAHTASQLLKYPRYLSFLEHFKGIYQDLKINVAQLAITIVMLPYQSYFHLDAIIRTLYRVYISKRNLLKWATAAQVESKVKEGSNFVLSMFKYSSVFSLGVFLLISFFRPYDLITSGLFIVAWLLSPLILDRIGQTLKRESFDLQELEDKTFRSIACRTWNFFETFVTKESHWLPPDNFQQEPQGLVAHRTSPTNIGLYLLSSCSAYNFGYIGIDDLLNRLAQTLSTMFKLSKQFGHFYNWYDTSNLEALNPEYISTVDSGNLAGHLLAVKQTCLEIKDKPYDHSRFFLGLQDVFFVIQEESQKLDPTLTNLSHSASSDLNILISECLILFINLEQKSIEEYSQLLDQIRHKTKFIILKIEKLSRENGNKHYEKINLWSQKAILKINNLKKEEKALDQSYLLELNRKCDQIAKNCHDLIMDMDFSVLYDKKRKLFSIGHNLRDGKNDESFYDLLASEARLTSLLAIAKGDVPESHWFHLGRQMTSIFQHRVLISWSASMFEYLMPLLVMKDYFGTLLHETHKSVVKQQMAYGALKKLPWGFSESAYNARDLNMNYQYGPFGVPGMGLKRGLSQDFVISPYSTALASMVLPKESLDNFKRLIENNFLTDYGFYEAIDYTEGRLPPKQNFAIVKNFMTHHQGMTLVALDNLLHHNVVRKRFHLDPMIKSSELLLQERVPQRISILHPRAEEVDHKKSDSYEALTTLQYIKEVNTEIPLTRVLSNGSYTVMLTASGSGFSKCDDYSVFRWHEDSTFDNDGQYFFISDDLDDSLTSLTFSPLNNYPENYKTTFSDHKAEFWCEKKDLSIHTEITVSAEDNVELRRLTITNLKQKNRSLDLTSYAEPVLSSPDTDISHPAFNKLFLETEYITEKSALLARRRKRGDHEEDLHGIHQIIFDKKKCSTPQYETDRSKFFGRRNSWEEAHGLQKNAKLSNALGGVLDPIFSFKTKINLKPFETTTILFIGGMAKSRDEALRLIDQYHDIHIFDREDKMAWTQSQIELRHLNLEIDEVNTFQKLVGALLFSIPQTRPNTKIIEGNKKSQADLWSYGISGDLPLLLVSIKDKHHMNFIQDILQLHEYLRGRNIQFDLVLLSEESSSYRMAIHDELLHQIRISGGQGLLNKRAGIFLLRRDLIHEADIILLKSVARIYLNAHQGTLKKQVEQLLYSHSIYQKEKKNGYFLSKWKDIPLQKPQLDFFNGYGGFKDNGREYQIYLEGKEVTPAPWINVISNPLGFGFIVSESGSSYTWSQNSRENRITPWSNDPILDPSGEILYLVDNNTKEFWSPTPGPIRNESPYLVKHGQGYSIFAHQSFEICQELTMYVSMSEEIKFIRLKLKNLGNIKRNISTYLYLEWVLGFHRTKTSHYIISEKSNNIFLARNPFQLDFENRVTFTAANKEVDSFTCDRASFLGRFRNYKNPLGLDLQHLDGKIGAELDPCLAIKIDLKLKAGEEDEIIFILGQTDRDSYNEEIINEHLTTQKANQTLEQVKKYWDETLNTIQIKTPYPEFDILINRWMLYQTLSSRIWARTAFYQSGGAYGFRDQLQDVTALIHTRPKLAREHILKAAAHQFPEGDVLHWWHPPTGKGVRTHFSDDLLWLPFVTNYYVETTGDESIFKEMIPFVEGPQLAQDQEDLYLQTTASKSKATLYEHCLLALDHSLRLGKHGLPLMGSGDWNDGMNRVGHKGQGESVWMAWFLGSNLNSFTEICQKRGDQKKAQTYKLHLDKLKTSVETSGWDGKWYRRAYFDDGTPLGSKDNDECQIDSIAQSWSILSNLGDKKHREEALNSAKNYLINEKSHLVHLFTPPFNKTSLDPGYIKGYLPGIRENGGQYTHAAIWLAMAFAEHRDSDTAFKIMGLINPLKHSQSKEAAQVYMTEPYVIPADIYSHPLHLGKGGWSWYTGSSGWFYRAFVESILGIYRQGKQLMIRPSLPKDLDEYEIHYTYGESLYKIGVKKSEKDELFIDEKFIGTEMIIPLVNDHKIHSVQAYISVH